MGVSFSFLLFYGGVELFCDIVKSTVVVGKIVLLPVLLPVLVPVLGCLLLGRGFSQLGGDERQLGHQVGG